MPTSTPRQRHRTQLVTLLAVAVALTMLLPAFATAQETRPGVAHLGAEVTIGFGRGPSALHWNLVEVTLSPATAVSGSVEVRTQGQMGSTANGVELEVAAGATKVVHLLMPPSEDVQVSFRPADGVPLQLGGRLGSSIDVLVGAVGAAPRLPDPLASVATDRAIRAVTVDPAVLAMGPRALEALDALVMPAAEVAALQPQQRDVLAIAVAQGLDLIVPMTPGSQPPDLPWVPATLGSAGLEPAADAWAVAAEDVGGEGGDILATAIGAGRGRVIATSSAPGADGDLRGLWPLLLQPRDDPGPPIARIEHGSITQGLFGSGVGLPGPAGTAVFVLLFLLAVGPLNLLLLRRLGRRELGWITVPAITLVFTVAAVGSAVARTPTLTPTVRASWWLDGVGQDVDLIGLQASTRETVRATLPGRRDVAIAEPWGGQTVSTRHTAERTEIGVGLQALQTAPILAWGATHEPPPLEVAAGFTDGVLTVEVANATDTPLTNLQVGVASMWRNFDDLAPGASTTVVLDNLDRLPRSRIAEQWERGFGGMDFPGGRAAPGPEAALALLNGGVLDERPGTVWVVGATVDPGGPTPGIRGSVDQRGRAVAIGVTPTHAGADVLPHEVARGFLRRGGEPWRRPGPTMIEDEDQIELRYRLPTPRAVGTLVSSLDAGGPIRNQWRDPWSQGCFEVTEITPDGEELDPVEHCGNIDAIACPDTAIDCSGEERAPGQIQMRSRLQDGTLIHAVRTGDAHDEVGQGALAGVEVWHVRDGAWVPASEVFADGTAEPDDIVSPLGEVLIRIRGAGFLDISQRGLAVGGNA